MHKGALASSLLFRSGKFLNRDNVDLTRIDRAASTTIKKSLLNIMNRTARMGAQLFAGNGAQLNNSVVTSDYPVWDSTTHVAIASRRAHKLAVLFFPSTNAFHPDLSDELPGLSLSFLSDATDQTTNLEVSSRRVHVGRPTCVFSRSLLAREKKRK